MFPHFVLLGRDMYTYPLLAAAGALLAGVLACRRASARGVDVNDMILLLLISAAGIFIGGHLMYALVNLKYVRYIFKEPFAALEVMFGGSVFYGGLLGGIAAGAICLKKKKRNFLIYSDLAAPAIPLFHAFGRIGCFLGGCCYGVPSDFGFVFTASLAEDANGVRRLPVQLIESAFLFALCAFLIKLSNRSGMRGKLLRVYLAVYAAFRFVIEFWRADEYRGIYFGLSTSQWISLAILGYCAVCALRRSNNSASGK